MRAPAVTLPRLDLASAASDPAVASAVTALLRRGAVPDQRVRDGARAILATVKAGRRRGRPRSQCQVRRRPGRWLAAGQSGRDGGCARRAAATNPGRARADDREHPPLRRDAAARDADHHDRPRRRDRAALGAAGERRRLHPGWFGRVSQLLAGWASCRPWSRAWVGSSSPRRRTRSGGSTRLSSARPGWSASTSSSLLAAPRRSGRSPTVCRMPGSLRSIA